MTTVHSACSNFVISYDFDIKCFSQLQIAKQNRTFGRNLWGRLKGVYGGILDRRATNAEL